jgi:hypothetical protein
VTKRSSLLITRLRLSPPDNIDFNFANAAALSIFMRQRRTERAESRRRRRLLHFPRLKRLSWMFPGLFRRSSRRVRRKSKQTLRPHGHASARATKTNRKEQPLPPPDLPNNDILNRFAPSPCVSSLGGDYLLFRSEIKLNANFHAVAAAFQFD